jgi:hypothetical protein
VGVAEHLDPAAAIWRAGIPEPAHAFLVIAEGCCVFQPVGHIEQRPGGPGVVPIDQPDHVAASPYTVPRAKVTMADDVTGRAASCAA